MENAELQQKAVCQSSKLKLTKKSFLYIICLIFLIPFRLFSQQEYQIDVVYDNYCPNSTHSLNLKIPKGVDVVKGILIRGNSGCSTTLYYIDDQLAYEFAKKINFAIMGTYNLGSLEDSEEFELFEDCIYTFGNMSGHPELVDAPFLFFGHSNGGMMTHNYATLKPEKCIATLVNSGGSYIESLPDIETLNVPSIFIAGEKDWPGISDQIINHFYVNRPRGALWAHLIMQNRGHSLGKETIKLYYLLAEEALKMRYPSDQSPINGPVSLIELTENSGWLSDSTTWKDGIIEIFEHGTYPNSFDSSSWHMSKDLAYLFAAHSTYDRIDNNAYFLDDVANKGGEATFHFEIKETWDSIYVYNKSSNIGSYYSNNDSIFDFEISLDNLGFYALFAKVYLSSGEISVTNFDAILVVNKVEPTNIGMPESELNSEQIVFYPNPCVETGYLESPNKIEAYILYSINGTKILEKQGINSKRIKVDLSSLNKGSYLLKCILENKQVEVIYLVK